MKRVEFVSKIIVSSRRFYLKAGRLLVAMFSFHHKKLTKSSKRPRLNFSGPPLNLGPGYQVYSPEMPKMYNFAFHQPLTLTKKFS